MKPRSNLVFISFAITFALNKRRKKAIVKVYKKDRRNNESYESRLDKTVFMMCLLCRLRREKISLKRNWQLVKKWNVARFYEISVYAIFDELIWFQKISGEKHCTDEMFTFHTRLQISIAHRWEQTANDFFL